MKRNQLSASSYQYLKEREDNHISFMKDKDTKRGVKVAIIFLIIAGAYALVMLSTTLCMFLLG